MLTDRYGYTLNTSSQQARDAYVKGVDHLLSSTHGAQAAFEDAIAHDPNFALAHIGLARHHQFWGDRDALEKPLAAALECTGLDARETAHVETFHALMSGRVGEGYKRVRAHVIEHQRDAMIAQTCTGVFSLIGFSGQPGRESELLAFTTSLAPAYGDDWWFNAQHAFSQMEAGQIAPAASTIETSIAGNPRNANASHIRSHLYYENGEAMQGFAYLKDWMDDYEREGLLHCHLSWHVALWALEQGDVELMWEIIDTSVSPATSVGPPLNLLTDLASILYRAERFGVDVPADRWQQVSAYASKYFPDPGIAFADAHAALAHAMSGNSEALQRIVENAKGPAQDIVKACAQAFGAIAAERWSDAEMHLTHVMSDHARLGGSRAQRDLLEFAWVSVLLRQGQAASAKKMLRLRRPHAIKQTVQIV